MTLPTTPSLAAARLELATLVEAARAAWSSYTLVVESENRNTVDIGSAAAQRPFLSYEIKMRGGGQASLGKDPLAVQYGQLIVSTKVKAGTGTAASYALLDHVIPFLEGKDLAVVRTELAEVYDDVTRQGWFCIPVIINFSIHRISPSV